MLKNQVLLKAALTAAQKARLNEILQVKNSTLIIQTTVVLLKHLVALRV